MAVGGERAHAERVGKSQCLAVVAFGVLRAAGQRNVTGEVEGVALAGAGPEPTGERQGLSGVFSRLVDPPGREGGRPRTAIGMGGPVRLISSSICASEAPSAGTGRLSDIGTGG